MSFTAPIIVAIVTNLIAITVLAYGLYFRRHRRADLLLAYTALNVGVMTVTMVLSTVEAGIGLGLGLFGILSIIRLRSDQITQQEIAYYFVSLVLGLLAGLHPTALWVVPAFSALILAVMWIMDSPIVAPRARHTTITLDRAYTQETELILALEQLLGGEVMRVEVQELDVVRDITVVDVRYRIANVDSSLTAIATRFAELVSK
ncbi:DUF4956 domain-containing protein [Jonesiaceae bacterium BS-20]|uniref:DUF4956 domain-containing protein n=1 Tax=Jonesiaceae bacterium BS-20 TaxID=3120821 RepID=A0AAU7DTS5_9MICO